MSRANRRPRRRWRPRRPEAHLTTAPISSPFAASLGGFDARRTPVLRTDVLVIGGGVAGACAALSAAAAGAHVLVVSKNATHESNTAYAQGGLAAVLGDDDSIALHVADTLRVGAGLSDADTTRGIVAEGVSVIDWMRELGAGFDIDEQGRLLLGREGGHSVERVVHAHGDSTGAEIQRTLDDALRRHPNITVRIGAFARDLLVRDGRCCGAVLATGDMELGVEAGAVLVACGGAGQVYRETTNPIGASGDGVALAFRAGAVLRSMEFVQFHPTTLYIAGASRFLISEVVRGAGATLRDRNGQRFMADVHPAAELAPRDVVSRAILERMVATGDTHVYLDLRTVRGDARAMFPSIARICEAFDIDIARDPIPVRPGAHYFIGGVRTDIAGASSIPGLWVAGEAGSTGLHGANRLASNSLLEGAVVGRRAGAAAARAALDHDGYGLPRRVPAPAVVENAPRLHLDDMLYSLKSLMWRQVGLLRTEQGLTEARDRLGYWMHYLMRAQPRTRQAWELTNMLTVSALVATAALARTESRGTHSRVDCPTRDDAVWCREQDLRRADDGSIDVVRGALRQPSDREPMCGTAKTE